MKMTPKICYANPFINNKDGSSVHTREFISAIREMGVTIIPCPDAKDNSQHDLLFRGSGTDRIKKFLPAGLINSFRTVRIIERLMRRLPRLLREARKCNIILSRPEGIDLTGVIAAKIRRIPLILELNAPYSIETSKYGGGDVMKYLNKIEYFSWYNANRIVVVSEVLKSILVTSGIDSNKIDINPNGVNEKLFTKTYDTIRTRSNLGIISDAFVVCYQGSLMPWHGVEILLEAMKILKTSVPKSRLVVIGKGKRESELKREALKKNISSEVVWVGSCEHNKIPEILAASDVCVAPYPKIEPFYFSPLKIFEYMASEKPTVASRQGQMIELLEDNRGILVEPSNPHAIARELELLYKNPTFAKEIGMRAKKYVLNNYTWRHNALRVLNACMRALKDWNNRV